MTLGVILFFDLSKGATIVIDTEELEADRERTYSIRDISGDLTVKLSECGVEDANWKHPLPDWVIHEAGSYELRAVSCNVGVLTGYITLTPPKGDRLLLKYECVEAVFNDEYVWIRGEHITSNPERPQRVRARERVHI